MILRHMFVAAVCVFGGWPSLAEAADAAPLRLQDVIQAWRLRQDNMLSVKLDWTESQVTDTEGLRLPDADLRAAMEKRGSLVRHTRNTVVLDGDRTRILEAPEYAEQEGDQRTMVFDGQTGKAIFLSPSLEYPQGGITNKPLLNKNIAKYFPVLLIFRITDEQLKPLKIDTLRLRNETEAIRGAECRMVETDGSGLIRRIWFDPQRAFAILRCESIVEAKVRSRTDFFYPPDDRERLVPVGWKIQNFQADGSARTAILADVQKVVVDPPVTDSMFELEFPVGTRYFDHRLGGKTLIVQADQKVREFYPEEISRGATQEDLLATPPGLAKRFESATLTWTSLLLWGNLIIVALALGLMFRSCFLRRQKDRK